MQCLHMSQSVFLIIKNENLLCLQNCLQKMQARKWNIQFSKGHDWPCTANKILHVMRRRCQLNAKYTAATKCPKIASAQPHSTIKSPRLHALWRKTSKSLRWTISSSSSSWIFSFSPNFVDCSRYFFIVAIKRPVERVNGGTNVSYCYCHIPYHTSFSGKTLFKPSSTNLTSLMSFLTEKAANEVLCDNEILWDAISQNEFLTLVLGMSWGSKG